MKALEKETENLDLYLCTPLYKFNFLIENFNGFLYFNIF